MKVAARCLIVCLVLASSIAMGASTLSPVVLCQGLLAARPEDSIQTILEIYRNILLDAGEDLVTTSDLESMIRTNDYFSLPERGSSASDHIATGLRELKGLLDHNIDRLSDHLHTLLSGELVIRNDSRREQRVEQKNSDSLPPLARRLQSAGVSAALSYATLSLNQKTLIEIYRRSALQHLTTPAYGIRVFDFMTGALTLLRDEYGDAMPSTFQFERYHVTQDQSAIELTSDEGKSYVLDLNSRTLKNAPFEPRLKKDGKQQIGESADRKLSVYSEQLGDLPGQSYNLWFSDRDHGVLQNLEGFVAPANVIPDHNDVTFASDSSFFVLTRGNEGITIWDTRPFRFRAKIKTKDLWNSAEGSLISPDGRFVVIEGRVFDATNGAFLYRLSLPGIANALAISPNSRWIAVNSLRPAPEIHIFDLRTGSLLMTLKTHSFFVGHPFFSQDGKFLLYRSQDYFWNVADVSGALGSESSP